MKNRFVLVPLPGGAIHLAHQHLVSKTHPHLGANGGSIHLALANEVDLEPVGITTRVPKELPPGNEVKIAITVKIPQAPW